MLFLLLSLWGDPAAAATPQPPALSVGVALPSLTGAVTENPAGLPGGSGRELEIGLNLNSLPNIDAYGMFASGKGTVGFGLGVQRSSAGSLTAAGGLGVKLGRWAVGLNATSPISGFAPRFGAGTRVEAGKARVGLYVQSLTSPTQAWTLGFAAGGSIVVLGLDTRFAAPAGGIAPTTAGLTPSLEVSIGRSLSILAAYGLAVMPAFASSPGFGAGMRYGMGRSWAVFAHYNLSVYPAYPLALGLNFAL